MNKTIALSIVCLVALCGAESAVADTQAGEGKLAARESDERFLKDLVRIPSVSADIPAVNRAVDFARADFERRGLFCTVLTNALGRKMLWVANVGDRKPDVVFSTHLDVVPAQVPEQFEPVEREGWLYGRGVADSKGHVVLTARVMEDLKGQVSVGALIASDEEMGGSTTRALMDAGFGGRKLAIVADVMPYTLTTWQKGLADYVIRIRKPAVHQGIKTGPLPSAIVDLMDGYKRLAAKVPEYEDGSWREMFTVMEIGGERDNAFMRFRVRPTDKRDWPRLERWIDECIGGEVTCTRKGDPVYVDEKNPLVSGFLAAMRARWPERDCRFLHYNSSTDARHVQYLGLPMLLLGLETADMHARNERVRLASIGEYAEVIERFLLERFALRGDRSVDSKKSPDGRNEIRAVTRNGVTRVQIFRDGRALVAPSEIGLRCADGVSVRLDLEARNEGVAYRWRTEAAGKIRVLDETINLRAVSPDQRLLIQAAPSDWNGDPLQNSWQNIARRTTVGELSSATNRLYYAPIVFLNDNSAMAVTESDLRDYPGWNVRRSASVSNLLTAVIARWPVDFTNEDLGRRRTDGIARYLRVTRRADHLVETEGPRTFPWRVFMLADAPKDLIGNRLVRDLATPSRVPDAVEWVKPGKVAWDWWNDWNLTDVGFKSACDTRTYEHYIDFAASNKIAYVIFDEGWSERLNIWKFAPNVDVPHLIRYAGRRGVGIILWAAWAQVFGQEERVAAHFGALGAKGFKIDFIDRDDAEAVRFVERFASVCAKRRLVVDYHGMYKPTGLEVTYPNILNYEGVHGLEMMKFRTDDDMMLNDINILFTRMLAGPVDYTPGAMRNFARGTYRASRHEPGSFGTRCRQMALVTLYDAPLQMLCDSPSQYRANAECLAFMAATPEVWDEVRPLAGEPDEFAVVAKRRGGDWYVAGITDWTPRALELDLAFLPPHVRLDGFFDTAEAARQPMAYSHRVESLPDSRKLPVRMGPGGGFVFKATEMRR